MFYDFWWILGPPHGKCLNNACLKDFAVSKDKQARILVSLCRLEAGDPITYTYEELVMSLYRTLTN